MSKCIRCGVRIMDDTDNCPLCHQVLTEDNEPKYDSYPDARVLTRRFRLFENIVLFLSIVAAVTLTTIDYMTSHMPDWSLLVVFALIYGNVLVRLAIVGKSGYIFKTICMVFLAIILLWGIDYLTGFKGWSLAFAFPGIILVMDIAIIVLMIVNKRNWQSYMMLQLLMIILSIIPSVYCIISKARFPYVAIAAIGGSAFLFLGTLIIGDQRAQNELKRRFHI